MAILPSLMRAKKHDWNLRIWGSDWQSCQFPYFHKIVSFSLQCAKRWLTNCVLHLFLLVVIHDHFDKVWAKDKSLRKNGSIVTKCQEGNWHRLIYIFTSKQFHRRKQWWGCFHLGSGWFDGLLWCTESLINQYYQFEFQRIFSLGVSWFTFFKNLNKCSSNHVEKVSLFRIFY